MDITTMASKKFYLLGLLFLVFALVALLPVYGSVYTVILMTAIFMYIVLTVSWVIFSGPTGYISLAPAAFFGVGIYTSAVLGKTLPLPMVFWVGVLARFSRACL